MPVKKPSKSTAVKKPSIMEKAKTAISSPTGKAVLAGVAGLAVGGAVGYALGKRKRKSTNTRLKNRLVKTALKIKQIQLERKLFKETMKGVV